MEQAQPPVAPSLKDTCQAARYAFEAYNAPGTSPTYASGSTGVAEVVFTDQDFVKRNLNTGNGGILVVELTDALALKPFCGVSLSVELCIQPRILRAAAAATAAKGEQQQGSIRGAAIHVSLPLKGQDEKLELGVRPYSGRQLLLPTLLAPPPARMRAAMIQLLPRACYSFGDWAPPPAPAECPRKANQMSFTWLLAPFSDNPFAAKNILPREQPLVKHYMDSLVVLSNQYLNQKVLRY
ncbi:hypothetical protein VOLCADRAFT_90226 [Volvox carteri f. nagariensis]|uniref:Uncharacterized protein n=1 Tax=Volvox carteri f. nagariensis TaxID=3068 RepID=D8TTT4_VOLCA|nr:uncharacterized protein VOLCADRAFT_90226 [Volvox carteri f. nagariensis]EFJ49024.1 hypothetical protein VOLCADRAFT_90226 [Volvox carteri f. nagariensis]|eukprot:XP_002949921.1 hypothetical protein VOLCADRAFT_90226 [Volvox carteri f. nagariensis]